MLAGDYPILKRDAAQICICGIGVLPRLMNYDDWRHQSGLSTLLKERLLTSRRQRKVSH